MHVHVRDWMCSCVSICALMVPLRGTHIHTCMCAWTSEYTYTAHTHTRISLDQNIFLIARPRATIDHLRQTACHHAVTQPASSCHNSLDTPPNIAGADLLLTPRCATSGCLRHHAVTQPASSCHNSLGTPPHIANDADHVNSRVSHLQGTDIISGHLAGTLTAVQQMQTS